MATPATKPAVKQPSFYKMRAQLLEQGRTNTLLARTDNMWATLKVYASGGENGLHMHPHEDHTFVVLQGKARYYDTDGGHTDVGKHEGIMLPAGAYYWFEAVSEEPLVLLRIGCRVGSGKVQVKVWDEPLGGSCQGLALMLNSCFAAIPAPWADPRFSF